MSEPFRMEEILFPHQSRNHMKLHYVHSLSEMMMMVTYDDDDDEYDDDEDEE